MTRKTEKIVLTKDLNNILIVEESKKGKLKRLFIERIMIILIKVLVLGPFLIEN